MRNCFVWVVALIVIIIIVQMFAFSIGRLPHSWIIAAVASTASSVVSSTPVSSASVCAFLVSFRQRNLCFSCLFNCHVLLDCVQCCIVVSFCAAASICAFLVSFRQRNLCFSCLFDCHVLLDCVQYVALLYYSVPPLMNDCC